MVEPLQIAKVLVEPIVRLVLAERRQRAERSLPLSELINVAVTDDLKRRKLSREIETIVDAVAERIDALQSHEWAGLSDAEHQAACHRSGRQVLSATCRQSCRTPVPYVT